MSLPDADRKAQINLAWQQYSRALDRSEKARQAYYAALDDERRISLFPVSKPLFDIFDRLQTAITTVEASSPLQDGTVKSGAVVTDFEAGLSVTQAILAVDGKKLVYDDAALQSAINAQVAAYNAFATLKASFKVVSLAVAAAPPAAPAA